MRRGNYNTIQSRLFLLFFVSMTAILLIVSGLFYNRSMNEFHDKITDLSKKNSSQTVALFDLMLKGYDSLSKSISNNIDVVRLLSQKNVSPAVEFINERSITNLIGAIYYSREDLMGVHVISSKGKVISYGDYRNVIDPEYGESDWYKRLKRSQGRMVWLGVFPQSIIDTSQNLPVFAFGRIIYDLNQYQPIGYVLFEAKPQLILSSMDNLKLGPNSQVNIVSANGDILAHSGEANLPADIDLREPMQQDSGLYKVKNEWIVTSSIPSAGWTIVSRTPQSDLNGELESMQRYLIVVLIALVCLSAAIAVWGSRTISSPIKRIVREMKQVETGNFNRVLTVKSYYEIGQLADSFNKMVARISELIEQIKISSVSEKNAELQALQSQVNPHFLYNTLDMIYWLLDEKGNDNLAEVVLALSQMFRYSSHWEEEVTLGAELEQIRHYLTIIELRLHGRLTVEINVDERWRGVRVPKMTLQPIIENAVKHGLEPQGRDGKLSVYAAREGDSLTIIVADNGVGMSGEELERLRQSLGESDLAITQSGSRSRGQEEAAQDTGGIGISNLHRRLKLMFGESYGLSVDSAPGQGTSVRIRLWLPERSERVEHTDRR
ncbi:sensor histidine kinase [Cohnella panacarvi]|uniref:sensor histidine kinase n=1 Tax=Cohnella panacarvi TaxID=400776 RepID=UPI00047EE4C5|nr:sensor histidine kinase [Cohnella panacarvi]